MADDKKGKRIFVYDGKEFPDPAPDKKVDDIRQAYVEYFPELANAETKETKRGDDTVYTFTKRVGTKGSDRPKVCRLGYCATKKSYYQAGNEGNEEALNKFREGICPRCGKPTDKKYKFETEGAKETKGTRVTVEVEIPDGRFCDGGHKDCPFFQPEADICTLLNVELEFHFVETSVSRSGWLKAPNCPNPEKK